MSNVYVIGDTHFGHKNVVRFRTEFPTVEDHDAFIIEQWHGVITPKDLVFVLGDAAFTREGLENFRTLPGRKILVRGNHDVFDSNRYLIYFEDIAGITSKKYKGSSYWLTHAPIHPDELRGRANIHGHVHANTIRDKNGQEDTRYYNVSAENIGYVPVQMDRLAEVFDRA